MVQKLNIYNVFGIKPKHNIEDAGFDFFIPNLKAEFLESEEFVNGIEKSYNINIENFLALCSEFKHLYYKNVSDDIIINMAFIFLAEMHEPYNENGEYLITEITDFIRRCDLIDDELNITIKDNMTLKINSGIKMILEPETVGIFFNRSGLGLKGWMTMSPVVDSGYRGYVHLSVKNISGKNLVIKPGMKFNQMVVFDIPDRQVHELTAEEFENNSGKTIRGDGGFGHTGI